MKVGRRCKREGGEEVSGDKEDNPEMGMRGQRGTKTEECKEEN